eukprot:6192010-Pleurochrysis_carterae.AAC.4
MRIALNHLGWDWTAAGEIPSEPGGAHGRRMIQQSSTRRGESQLQLACVQLRHKLGVAFDVAFKREWVRAAGGLVLRERELVAERAPNIDKHVGVSVRNSGFERGLKFTTFGVSLIVSLEHRFDTGMIESSVVIAEVVVRPQLVGAVGLRRRVLRPSQARRHLDLPRSVRMWRLSGRPVASDERRENQNGAAALSTHG